MWTVTRQNHQHGQRIEVSKGSYLSISKNPLYEYYKKLGESKVFYSAVEAVKVAIAIRNQWQKDGYDSKIFIGSNKDEKMPFRTYQDLELLFEAEELDARTPKCCHCKGLIMAAGLKRRSNNNVYCCCDCFYRAEGEVTGADIEYV